MTRLEGLATAARGRGTSTLSDYRADRRPAIAETLQCDDFARNVRVAAMVECARADELHVRGMVDWMEGHRRRLAAADVLEAAACWPAPCASRKPIAGWRRSANCAASRATELLEQFLDDTLLLAADVAETGRRHLSHVQSLHRSVRLCRRRRGGRSGGSLARGWFLSASRRSLVRSWAQRRPARRSGWRLAPPIQWWLRGSCGAASRRQRPDPGCKRHIGGRMAAAWAGCWPRSQRMLASGLRSAFPSPIFWPASRHSKRESCSGALLVAEQGRRPRVEPPVRYDLSPHKQEEGRPWR